MTEHEHHTRGVPVDDAPLPSATGQARLGDEPTTISGLAYSQTPSGEWDVKRAQHELKVAATTHEQEIQRERLKHELEEQAKDNHNRRQREMLLFYAGLFTGVTLLVIGLLVGVVLDTSEAKSSWARSIVTAILGGFCRLSHRKEYTIACSHPYHP